jgi:acyl-CoA synthetase (AMP-forming)/AMP-acid ligase II
MITQNIINKNLTVTSIKLSADNLSMLKETINYTELILLINQAKHFLLDKKCKPGQTVILCNQYWPEYLSWFFACAELGLIFVVSDYPKTEAALKKLEVYGEIDHIIYDICYPPGFAKFEHKLINSKDYKTYPTTETPILASDDSILLLSTSSGTTGTPKVISHTHKFFYDLLERNNKIYNLKETDKCMHSKNLHHGSVTGVYFLPTIKYCSTHYHVPYRFIPNGSPWPHGEDQFMQTRVNLIQEEKINNCLVFYEQLELLNNLLDLNKKQHTDLTFFVLSKISAHHIDNLVGKFNYTVKSIYGCTETSGPLLLPSFTPGCNLKNFGKQLDDHYKLTLDEDSFLTVEMPDGSVVKPGDKFTVQCSDLIFQGRSDLYRINGKVVYLDFFNETLERILNKEKEKDFDIVIDNDRDSIYIRLNADCDLDWLNNMLEKTIGLENYFISKKIIEPRLNFFSGIKFDPESIRIMCRNEL